MTTFDLPEPELVNVRLDPSQRVTLGGGVAVEAEEERIWLGRPVCLPPHVPEPVAWSMVPFSDSDPVNVARKESVNASLKLKGHPLPFDIGPSMKHENDRSYTQRAVRVEALREGKSNPGWTFSETEVSPIRGDLAVLEHVADPRAVLVAWRRGGGALAWPFNVNFPLRPEL